MTKTNITKLETGQLVLKEPDDYEISEEWLAKTKEADIKKIKEKIMTTLRNGCCNTW